MWATIKALVGAIRRGLADPWVVVLIALMTGGALLFYSIDHETTKVGKAMGHAATAILSGGIAGGVMKAVETSGLFTDIVEKALRQWIGARPTLDDSWRLFTARLLHEQLDEKARDQIVDSVAKVIGVGNPTAHEAHYEHLKIEYDIQWDKTHRDRYVVKEVTKTKIIPRDANTAITWKYTWNEEVHDGQAIEPKITIDGADVLVTKEMITADGSRRLHVRAEQVLHGKAEYSVVRSSKRTSSIAIEPYIRLQLTRLTKRLELEIRAERGPRFRLSEAGLGFGFRTIYDGEGVKHYESDSPLLPGHGFSITLTRS